MRCYSTRGPGLVSQNLFPRGRDGRAVAHDAPDASAVPVGDHRCRDAIADHLGEPVLGVEGVVPRDAVLGAGGAITVGGDGEGAAVAERRCRPNPFLLFEPPPARGSSNGSRRNP